MIGSGDKSEIKRFVNSTRHQVLVIGYEKVRLPFLVRQPGAPADIPSAPQAPFLHRGPETLSPFHRPHRLRRRCVRFPLRSFLRSLLASGHRLKSKDAKTSKMFDHLKSKRSPCHVELLRALPSDGRPSRAGVILSGTPLQNDLHEYWSMVDFVNPGILDSYSAFNKLYEKPIVSSASLQL